MEGTGCEEDIRQHKIKEAMVWKKSRYLKEWRERWVVLTENNVYSFEKKQVYRNPTEVLPVAEIETLKLYHKEQQERPFSFRLESKNLNFYLSCSNNQEKWSWVSAVERMIDRKQNNVTNDRRINEVVNRSTFITRESLRSTFTTQGGRTSALDVNKIMQANQPSPEAFKKNKTSMGIVRVDSLAICPVQKVQQEVRPRHKQEQKPMERQRRLGFNRLETLSVLATKIPQPEHSALSVSQIRRLYEQKQQLQSTPKQQEKPEVIVPPEPKVIEKVVEKIVDRIVQKKVVVEVKVPEIVERIVEKIVYLQKRVQGGNGPTDRSSVLNRLFEDILSSEEDYRFFVLFVVELATHEKLQYSEPILQACLTHQHSRFFAEAFLQIMNRESEDETLNSMIKFVILMYEKTEDYFYLTDVKVLLDILVRQLEHYRSGKLCGNAELNHFLILTVLRSLSIKSSWMRLEGYRGEDLRALVEQIEKISPSVENQTLAHELLTYIS